MGHIDLNRRFLTCLGVTTMPFFCLLSGTIFHFIISWYFVIHLQLGIKGTGMAGVLMNLVVLMIQSSYTSFMLPEIDKRI
jgi:Na+-driven multidrug efflux pump